MKVCSGWKFVMYADAKKNLHPGKVLIGKDGGFLQEKPFFSHSCTDVLLSVKIGEVNHSEKDCKH